MSEATEGPAIDEASGDVAAGSEKKSKRLGNFLENVGNLLLLHEPAAQKTNCGQLGNLMIRFACALLMAWPKTTAYTKSSLLSTLLLPLPMSMISVNVKCSTYLFQNSWREKEE